MTFADKFRYILKPLFVSTTVATLVTLFFVSAYAFLEYHWYLSTYQTIQQNELKSLQHKAETTIEDLKSLSKLTEARILASDDDLERIQNILISVYRLLPNYSFPKIQKVSYAKLSKPQMMVTRIGLSPLDLKSTPVIDPLEKGPSLVFGDNTLVSKTLVRHEKDKLEGVLEIQIDFADFRDFLGRFETITLSPFSGLKEGDFLLQQKPFKVYAKAPESFWEFVITNKIQYISMVFLCLLLITLVNIRFYFFLRRLQNIYGKKTKKLKAQIAEIKEKKEYLEKELNLRQKDLEHSQISSEAYNALHNRLRHRKSEHIHYILRSLEIVKQAFLNKTTLPEKERIEILESCKNTAHLLSENLIVKTKTESINLQHLLDELLLLFSERIYKFNIAVDVNCPQDLSFEGDNLFTGFILVTLIGKPLYRVPKNGKVSIVMGTQKNALHCEVEDNGYFFADDKEEFINKSFDLFMLQDAFRQTCQDNGLIYEHSKTDKGRNLSKIIFPPPSQDISTHNVIPLFK